MKRSVAIILIVVISVAAVALVAFVGKGAVTVIGQIGDIFGSGGEFPDLPSAPNSPDLPHESDTGLKFTETEPIETEPLLPPLNSGKLKFDGLALTILLPDTELYHREWGQKVAQNEIDEAIEMRNLDILNDLDVEILYKFVPTDTEEFFDLAFGDVLGDEHNYDIALNGSAVMSRLALRGTLSDLRDSASFPFLDLTQPCWNASANENLTVGGKLYFTTGFFSTTMLDNTTVMFQNKTIYDKNRANSDPENLQVYANEGKWTYEDMYRMTSAFAASMPNDDVLIIDRDLSDNNILRSFAAAFEAHAMRRYNNSREYDLASNSRAEAVLTRTKELYSTPGVVVGETAEFAGKTAKFGGEKGIACEGIFFITKLYKDYETNMSIREMEDKFGLMPLPKYDAAQGQYKALSDGSSFIGILDHSRSDAKTHSIAVSAFIEKTAEGSYTQVLGYYFNGVVKPRYFGTDDQVGTVSHSIEAFDTIIHNIEFEFCNVYSAELGGIGDIWGEAYSNNKTLAQSYLDKQSEYEESLSKLDKFFGVSQ